MLKMDWIWIIHQYIHIYIIFYLTNIDKDMDINWMLKFIPLFTFNGYGCKSNIDCIEMWIQTRYFIFVNQLMKDFTT